ncbi:ATP-binding protein, partial [Angustibacter aerolatus]
MPPSTPFVGRSDDLAQLAALTGVRGDDGAASAVLLGGDAGVGKTRLLGELQALAAQAGQRVLVGHCLDLAEQALPYLPLTEVLTRLAHEEPAAADRLLEAHPALALLVRGRRATGDDGAVDRADLFAAVHAGLALLADDGPVLLVVEDAHWADPSTRELVTFLLTRGTAATLVLSYRTDDLHRRHPLRPLVAQWARLPGVVRLPLRPLDDDAVRTLVGALAPLDEPAVRGIVSRAEGNAFFAEELVAAGDAGGRLVSADLADVLLARFEHLPDDARQVVRAAAVAGRRVSHRLLAATAELDDVPLGAACAAAVDANVLVPHGADGYAFRHALLAEAVYDDLLPGERVRLHAAYASALASGRFEGVAAELARHARAAHDHVTALRASVQAGDEALRVAGYDEALQQYEVALEELRADVVVDGLDPTDVVLHAMDAAVAAGRSVRALSLVLDHLTALPADAEPLRRARLLHGAAVASLLSDEPVDRLALTTEALQQVPAEPPTALRARVLAVH